MEGERQCHDNRGFCTSGDVDGAPGAVPRPRQTTECRVLCGSNRRGVLARLGGDRLAACGPLSVTGSTAQISVGASAQPRWRAIRGAPRRRPDRPGAQRLRLVRFMPVAKPRVRGSPAGQCGRSDRRHIAAGCLRLRPHNSPALLIRMVSAPV